MPVTQVMTVCMRMMTSNPSTPPPTTSTATTSRAMSLVAVPLLQPSWSNTCAVASVASETSAVSQPTVRIQDSSEGARLPLTPKAARLSTSVGAEPRLPAMAMRPQSRNDTTMPMTPAIRACQKEMPKNSRNEPYARPKTLTLAPNQGQNSCRGVPLRSASLMTLMPLVSTATRGVGASRAASTASELDCCAMGGTLAAAGPLIPDPPGVVDVPGAGGCDQAVDHAREQRGTLLRR